MRALLNRRGLLSVAVAAVLAALLAGCSLTVKACGDNQYPVKRSDGTPGSHCVDKGKPPESGFTTYPPGQTPTQ